MSDFNIQITVRNGRLLRAIREAFGSSAELCRATGINAANLSALLTMRDQPFSKNGSLTKTAEAVVSALGIPADDLWPDHVARLKARRARVEIEMDAPTFAAIADGNMEAMVIYRQAITRWSRDISDRERTALSVHHSGGTLDDVGEAIGGVSRARARAIILRGHRKIRDCAARDGVKSFRDLAE